MLIKGGEVVTEGAVIRADVLVEDGRIAAIGTGLRDGQVLDASGCYVLPGAVDPHVHIATEGDPNMEPIVEDLATASRTALLGGVTTICVYVRSVPGRTLPESVQSTIRTGCAAASVDFAINALCLPDDEIERVVPACAELGVRTFKAMLAYRRRGLMLDDGEVLRLMRTVAELGGMVIVHAENGRATEYLEEVERRRQAVGPDSYLRSAPGALEAEGIFRAVTLARLAQCPVLFAHLSAREAVATLGWIKAQPGGERVFCETQPHYLLLTNQQVLERGPLGKVGPPLREDADVAALRRALAEGLISHLCSDHAPRTTAIKHSKPDILDAPYGGVAGVELLLPLAHRLVMEDGSLGVVDLARLTATNAAKVYGLYPRKGVIQPGADADLVLLPKEGTEVTIGPDILHGRSDYSLYEGLTSRGFPRVVVRQGRVAAMDGEIVENGPANYLARTAAPSI